MFFDLQSYIEAIERVNLYNKLQTLFLCQKYLYRYMITKILKFF